MSQKRKEPGGETLMDEIKSLLDEDKPFSAKIELIKAKFDLQLDSSCFKDSFYVSAGAKREEYGPLDQWLLKWILNQIEGDEISLKSPALHQESWKIIQIMLYRLPATIVSPLFIKHNFMKSLEQALYWLTDRTNYYSLSTKYNDDEENVKLKVVSPRKKASGEGEVKEQVGNSSGKRIEKSQPQSYVCTLFRCIFFTVQQIENRIHSANDRQEQERYRLVLNVSLSSAAAVLANFFTLTERVCKTEFNCEALPNAVLELADEIWSICTVASKTTDERAVFLSKCFKPMLSLYPLLRYDVDTLYGKEHRFVRDYSLLPAYEQFSSLKVKVPTADETRGILEECFPFTAWATMKESEAQNANLVTAAANLLSAAEVAARECLPDSELKETLFKHLIKYLNTFAEDESKRLENSVSTELANRTLRETFKVAKEGNLRLDPSYIEWTLKNALDRPSGSQDWILVGDCVSLNPKALQYSQESPSTSIALLTSALLHVRRESKDLPKVYERLGNVGRSDERFLLINERTLRYPEDLGSLFLSERLRMKEPRPTTDYEIALELVVLPLIEANSSTALDELLEFWRAQIEEANLADEGPAEENVWEDSITRKKIADMISNSESTEEVVEVGAAFVEILKASSLDNHESICKAAAAARVLSSFFTDAGIDEPAIGDLTTVSEKMRPALVKFLVKDTICPKFQYHFFNAFAEAFEEATLTVKYDDRGSPVSDILRGAIERVLTSEDPANTDLRFHYQAAYSAFRALRYARDETNPFPARTPFEEEAQRLAKRVQEISRKFESADLHGPCPNGLLRWTELLRSYLPDVHGYERFLFECLFRIGKDLFNTFSRETISLVSTVILNMAWLESRYPPPRFCFDRGWNYALEWMEDSREVYELHHALDGYQKTLLEELQHSINLPADTRSSKYSFILRTIFQHSPDSWKRNHRAMLESIIVERLSKNEFVAPVTFGISLSMLTSITKNSPKGMQIHNLAVYNKMIQNFKPDTWKMASVRSTSLRALVHRLAPNAERSTFRACALDTISKNMQDLLQKPIEEPPDLVLRVYASYFAYFFICKYSSGPVRSIYDPVSILEFLITDLKSLLRKSYFAAAVILEEIIRMMDVINLHQGDKLMGLQYVSENGKQTTLRDIFLEGRDHVTQNCDPEPGSQYFEDLAAAGQEHVEDSLNVSIEAHGKYEETEMREDEDLELAVLARYQEAIAIMPGGRTNLSERLARSLELPECLWNPADPDGSPQIKVEVPSKGVAQEHALRIFGRFGRLDAAGRVAFLRQISFTTSQKPSRGAVGFWQEVAKEPFYLDERGPENKESLGRIYMAALDNMKKATTVDVFRDFADTARVLLEKNPWVINQHHIDSTLSTLVVMCSSKCALRVQQKVTEVSINLIGTLRETVKYHRIKLGGRFHLLVEALNSLLRCLFYPYTAETATELGLPAWLRGDIQSFDGVTGDRLRLSLEGCCASMISQIISEICDPIASSAGIPGARSQHRHHPLSDASKKARSIAGQHMQYVLGSYCKLRSRHRLPAETATALREGIYCIFDAMSVDVTKALSASLDTESREIFKVLYDDYQKNYKWDGA